MAAETCACGRHDDVGQVGRDLPHLAGSRWVAEVDGRREKRSAPVVRVQPGRTRVTLRALD
ncbi:MAG: hypothetical protein R6T96_15495 [Longimicrobiales bacterium]